MKKSLILFSALSLSLALSACSGGTYKDYLRIREIPPPTIEKFSHCYNYGCQTKVKVSLPKSTQTKLKKHFTPRPKTAEKERQKIATAIEIFEKDIGALTGTKNDKYGTFRLYQDDAKTTQHFQQDCIDESTNTTTYLGLLNEMGYLKFHQPAFPTSRQPFFGGGAWWHQSATIKDIASGDRYAVDSWFRDNGHPAFIVPLKEWKNGWRPAEQTAQPK